MYNFLLKYLPGLLITCIVACCPLSAQVNTKELQDFISTNLTVKDPDIKAFYEYRNYNSAWIGRVNDSNRLALLNTWKYAADRGLDELDYEFNLAGQLTAGDILLHNKQDSLDAELKLTKAALQYLRHLANGNRTPDFSYNGWQVNAPFINFPLILSNSLPCHTAQLFPYFAEPALTEIHSMEAILKKLNAVRADSGFREVTIASTALNPGNKMLVAKLKQLGLADSSDNVPTEQHLKEQLKRAQRLFVLVDDGVLRSTILHELNVTLATRIKQLNLSLNYYRWLNGMVQNRRIIVVNIPAAYMKVYEGVQSILEMRMVVGKKSTPTPTLTSTVKEVVLYPYWHVPYSIATKELLPILKRNPGYIDEGSYQVLGKTGKIMDPYRINWRAYSRAYFPFILRQSTGCDNALGLLKLNFYNPFGVYLHDTPVKNSFMLNKRYFSHGCMRMEKPMELGHLLLKNNYAAIDSLEQKGCIRNQAPVIVPADEHMPVIVWYNLVGVDSTGNINFYEDIYGKFNSPIKKNQ